MDRRPFGNILSSERRKLGLTIEQVAASTRIRIKFLVAFEKGDFAAMPPPGYAQNMIASYARFLDLDPKPLLEEFRKDYAQYEMNVGESDYDVSNTSVSDARPSNPVARRVHSPSRTVRSANTDAYLGRKGGNSRDQGSRRRRESAREQGARRRNDANARRLASSQNSPHRNARSGNASYNAYKDNPGNGNRKLILLAILAVLFIILVIWGITSCAARRNATTSTKPNTSVTTLSPTPTPTTAAGTATATPGATAGATTVTTAAGTPFTISFEVAADSTSDMQVTVDGNTAYSGNAVGPLTETYSVTSSVQMTIGSPDNVTVKRDDAVVKPTLKDGKGTIDLKTS